MGRPHRWKASAFLRLNSFGTVRHHRDVNSLSFTDRLPFVPLLTVTCTKNKKPCLLAVSRVLKFSFDSLPAYLRFIQIRFGALPAIRFGQPNAERTTLA